MSPSLDNWKTILGVSAALLAAGIWIGTLQARVNSLDPAAVARAQEKAVAAVHEAEEAAKRGLGSPSSSGTPKAILVPVGTIVAFGGPPNKLPSGWLACEGQRLQIAGNETLYNAIGIAWGGEEGVYFRLPDLRGEFMRGADNGRGVDQGRLVGTPQEAAVGQHVHPLSQGIGVSGGWNGGWGNQEQQRAVNAPGDGSMIVNPNSGPAEPRPRNLAVNFAIFAGTS